MLVDSKSDTIALRYDARNKESKSYKFDKVCDGQFDQNEFFKQSGVK